MAVSRRLLTINDLRSGINQIDPPLANGPASRWMEDARNIEFSAGGVAKKRLGCAEPGGLTYSATSGKIASLFRHAIGTSEQSTELWYLTDGGGIGRMPISSLTASSVAPGDALTTSQVMNATAVSLNGKLFVAAKNAADRLHVWDGVSYRRVGIKMNTVTAPTTAESAGAATDVRRYRVTYVKKDGADYQLRSEPSNETGDVTLTAERCTVTKNTSPGESETHWELWASSTESNFSTWYKIDEAVIATTTIVDNNADLTALTSYGQVAEFRGENEVFPSAKFLCTDDNRLLAAGSWENPSIYASRVWFSPVLGATDIGDDERTPNSVGANQKYYVDVARGVDGGVTGIAGPLADAIYVFKTSSIWKLIKTGVATNPYRVVNVHRNIGALNHKSIVLGEDEGGQPAIYFLSRRGPYRISTRGLEYIGADIETTFRTINYDAESVMAHGVYLHTKHQVWWWIATGASDIPDTLLVYDTQRGIMSELGVRGGWTIYDGKLATAYCSVMYSKDLGVTNGSYDLLPYFGRSDVNDKLIRAEVAGTYTDYDGVGYVSYFRTQGYALGGLDKRVSVEGIAVAAKPETDKSPCLWVRCEQNWNTTWCEFHVSIPPSDLSRVLVSQPEKVSYRRGLTENDVVSVYVYDNASQLVGWQIDAIVVEYNHEGER